MDGGVTWLAGRGDVSLAEFRRRSLARIVDAGLAGHGAGHLREINLRAVRRFIAGDADCAWNYEDSGAYPYAEVLAMLASVTGCSSNPKDESGEGYISPHKTLEGIEEAAARMAAVASGGGNVLLATGHPGALLSYYNGVAGLVKQWGGRPVRPAIGMAVPPAYYIDYIGSVALITDYAGLPHTHDHRAMEILLRAAGTVDLVVADHGYAGAAIQCGVPVVAVMDTNDPALAVWKYAGADLTIIPLDDNRPSSTYGVVVDLLREFGNRAQGIA